MSSILLHRSCFMSKYLKHTSPSKTSTMMIKEYKNSFKILKILLIYKLHVPYEAFTFSHLSQMKITNYKTVQKHDFITLQAKPTELCYPEKEPFNKMII